MLTWTVEHPPKTEKKEISAKDRQNRRKNEVGMFVVAYLFCK